METSAFIEALTETLLISTAQAFAVVLFFRVMFSAVPDIPSAIKYRLWYSSLVLIFGLFVYTLTSLYGQKLNQDTVTTIISANQSDFSQVSWIVKLEEWKLQYSGWIASFYFSGVFLQTVSLILSWLRTRSLGKAEPLFEDPVWIEKLNALRRQLQIVKHVGLHVSERIKVPVTAGFIKPIILLPVAMVARLSPEQVESILLHELAHIKRRDYLWNIIQKVIESILFFNPFVWLIVKEIHKEREYCCDEIVVSKTADPLTYAKALLQLEVQIKHNELTMAANGAEKYPLLDRIKRISGMKNPDPSPKTGLIVLATILCVGLSLAIALPQDKTDVVYVEDRKPTTVNERLISRIETKTVTTKIKNDEDTFCSEDALPRIHQEQLQRHVQKVEEHTMQQVKHQEEIQKHAEEIRKHFESQQWKDMQKEIAEHGVALAHAAVAAKHLEELPEPPAEPGFIKEHGKLQQKFEKLQRKFESSEWQEKHIALLKKVTDITRKVTSVEWEKKGGDIEIQVENLVRSFEAIP